MDTAAPSTPSTRRPRSTLRNVFFGLAVALIAAIAGGAVFTYQSDRGATADEALYRQQLKVLDTSLAQAKKDGYSASDLKPITGGEKEVTDNSAPATPWSRDAYYKSQAVRVAQLEGALQGLLPEVLSNEQSTVSDDIAQAQTLLAQNQQQGGDVSALQSQVSTVQQQATQARTISEVNAAAASAQSVIKQATAQAATLKQENAEIQAAANQLLAQTTNVQTLQSDGQTALTNANNDASLAAYQNFGGRFKDYSTLMASYDRVQYFSSELASVDPNQVAFAAAAEQMYASQIHTTLMADLPAKFIVVSFQAQRIWAYQNGQQVQTTLVTSGIRGVSTDGTDFGPMQILHKNHPWTMVSPWPQSSPLYYSPAVVQYASFFTDSGEAIHDATWEPDSALGPGSQYDAAYTSHGCVHVPMAIAAWFYNWVDVGTQMDVYPGDGTSVQNQLSQITTNAKGQPLDPA